MDITQRVASRFINAEEHRRSIALMGFLSGVAKHLGVAEHIYVVGGAVRNFLIGQPIKDIDVVVDSVSLGGRKDSAWFAQQVARSIPAGSNVTTNQYGVAIITVSGSWILDGEDMRGEVIEIANARKESYSGVGGKGKGYKPTDVQPATIEEDVFRREFTFNTLLWRLLDLAEGPDKAEVIDLTGLGRQHLEERLMHTPLDPDRTFTDDPTRMLRAIKFFVKYGLNLSSEVMASIKANAAKLKDMPWEAVATILVRDILDTPKAREALVMMKPLGLIDVLADMIRTEKPFAAFMAGQMTADKDVQILLDLAGLGLGDKAVSFLAPAQQERLREITVSMPRGDASAFLTMLKTPPIDNMALIEEFSLPPKDRGILAPTARRLLLEQPELAVDPAGLTDAVRREIARR
jgi:tRNA nucleotidyltransferase/poly(A) polymerase